MKRHLIFIFLFVAIGVCFGQRKRNIAKETYKVGITLLDSLHYNSAVTFLDSSIYHYDSLNYYGSAAKTAFALHTCYTALNYENDSIIQVYQAILDSSKKFTRYNKSENIEALVERLAALYDEEGELVNGLKVRADLELRYKKSFKRNSNLFLLMSYY